ncbi:unnamed protein product [Periconia digitata]|uniref:Uncharacterized protein n=1 Tax=Periconia digitata TaxID=1303443 RepID=A0A9W4XGN3_9PLEO|nr:unnamed protein product [Periconia digitata]
MATIPPPKWWEDEEHPNTLQWKHMGGENTVSTKVSVAMDQYGTLQPHEFFGPAKYVRWWTNYLHAGYKYQHTIADGYCGIWALQISLAPIYEMYGMIPPDASRLYEISQSSQVEELFRESSRAVDLVSEAPEVSEDWFEHYHLSATLRILGEADGLEFGFGVVTQHAEDRHSVSVDSTYRRASTDAAERDWDGIVWIHNLDAYHWSGIAPDPDVLPYLETKKTFFVIDVDQSEKSDLSAPKSEPNQPSASPHNARCETVSNSTNITNEVDPSPSQQTSAWSTVNDWVRNISRGSTEQTNPRGTKRVSSNSSSTMRFSKSPPSNRLRTDTSFQASDLRRPSHYMDWEATETTPVQGEVTPEQKSFLQEMGLPSNMDIRQFGGNVFLSMKMQDLASSRTTTLLYHDVEGNIPVGHKAFNERDPMIGPWRASHHQQLIEEAQKKSLKPITHAPKWFDEIPWDNIEGISIEEFIIYFPNHAVRWPGIALYIRHLGWDRLFYRMTRMINLARGTHQMMDQSAAVVQVLPLMMKMQHAIRHFDPNYKIGDHPQIDMDFIAENIKVKPYKFPKYPVMASVAEADGYIAPWVNEFENRPFSRRIKQSRQIHAPNMLRASSKHPEKFPFRLSDADHIPTNVPQIRPERFQNDVPMSSPSVAQFRVPSRPFRSSTPLLPTPNFDEDSLDFTDVDDEIQINPVSPTPKAPLITVCNFDRFCNNVNCSWAHSGPAARDNVVINTELPACRFALNCKNTECARSHPSPAGLSQPKGQRDERGHKSGAKHKRTENVDREKPYVNQAKGNRDQVENKPRPQPHHKRGNGGTKYDGADRGNGNRDNNGNGSKHGHGDKSSHGTRRDEDGRSHGGSGGAGGHKGGNTPRNNGKRNGGHRNGRRQ